MTLPNFVVIGAMKAGTVSLGHYLDEHPNVYLGRCGRFNEPNYFIAEQNWPRGRGWYESLFDRADRAAAIGECSPSYTWAKQPVHGVGLVRPQARHVPHVAAVGEVVGVERLHLGGHRGFFEKAARHVASPSGRRAR